MPVLGSGWSSSYALATCSMPAMLPGDTRLSSEPPSLPRRMTQSATRAGSGCQQPLVTAGLPLPETFMPKFLSSYSSLGRLAHSGPLLL